MADIEVIKEHADGYAETGHTVTYTDGYIKFRKTFRYKAMRLLKGAPLSVFLDVALADEPPGVQTICDDTGYGRNSVCEALDYLVSHNFLEELGRDGKNGVKCYRAKSFTWSGSDRNVPPDVDDSSPIPSAHRSTHSKLRHAQSTLPPVVVVDPLIQSDNQSSKEIINNNREHDETRQLLREAGIFFPQVLERLAGRVKPETAQLWKEWAQNAPKGLRNPAGIAVQALTDDPTSEPIPNGSREETFGESFRKAEARARMLDEQQTCGTLAHKLWAPSHGGCAECGIPAK